MSEVKRYSMKTGANTPKINGSFVKYSDYQSISEKLKQAEEKLNTAVELYQAMSAITDAEPESRYLEAKHRLFAFLSKIKEAGE